MTKHRVVVTGIGVICANGDNKDEFFENTINGVSGLKECSLFDGSKLSTSFVGEIEREMPYLTTSSDEPERIDHIVKNSVEELLEDSGLTKKDIQQMEDRACLSFATSLASNGRILGYVNDKENGKQNADWLVKIPQFVSTIKEETGVEGGCYTTMSACAAGTTAAGIAFDLIQQENADLVIVGGADPMTEFSNYGFHALRSLSNSRCRPFDKNRDGINIGEGGAFFTFETFENAKKRGAKIYGEVLGYGINNDAYHITSPDPKGVGAMASMNMAIKDHPHVLDKINYVNAHGTGTKLNDVMEASAIDRFFEKSQKQPHVSSNKSMIGHCLAAAGALELASTLLSIHHQTVPPTIRLEDKLDECGANRFNSSKEELVVEYALSNSFAFAGNTASIFVGRVYE